MSKNLWIIIFVVLVVVLVSALFLGPGLVNPKGKYTRDEFTQDVGVPTNITRSIPVMTGPGEDLQVFLNVQLGGADTYFIDESIPQGFDVVTTGGGTASTDSSGRTHIKYGAFSGATGSPSHYYVLKIPSSVSGSYDFYGEYIFGKGTSQVDIISIISGINVITFQNGSLNISSNIQANIYIDGNNAGVGRVELPSQPKNYTIGFQNISGYVRIDSVIVSVVPGKITTVTCNYMERDPADSDANGIIRPLEMNTAIGWFLNAQPDPATNQTYTMQKLAKSISKLYRESYYPKSDQCHVSMS